MPAHMEGSPWISIWLHPRETIRSIVSTRPNEGFKLLCALNGFPMALGIAQNLSLGGTFPSLAILLGALVLCFFLGFIGISVSSWLLSVTGKWIGGSGSYRHIRSAVAWSNVPNIITVATWLVLTTVFSKNVFCSSFSEMQFMGYQAGIVFVVFLLQSIASIWGIIILLKALGEVQGFSVWRAVLNVLIPFVIVVALIWFVGWVGWGRGNV